MMTTANINAEVEEIGIMYDIAQEIVPDLKQKPSKEITGNLVKWYKYDAYGDVVVERYENGALLLNNRIGYREWYGKANVNKCFDKAKTLGGRNKRLNRLMY